jgi:hypothetical protein
VSQLPPSPAVPMRLKCQSLLHRIMLSIMVSDRRHTLAWCHNASFRAYGIICTLHDAALATWHHTVPRVHQPYLLPANPVNLRYTGPSRMHGVQPPQYQSYVGTCATTRPNADERVVVACKYKCTRHRQDIIKRHLTGNLLLQFPPSLDACHVSQRNVPNYCRAESTHPLMSMPVILPAARW